MLKRISTIRSYPFALRMAPMIDMVFLLLLFFLVAVKWRPQEDFLPFVCAGAAGLRGDANICEPLVLAITSIEDGCRVSGPAISATVGADRSQESLSALAGQLTDALIRQRRTASDPLLIICQDDVKWEYLARIYNVLFGTGATNITFQMSDGFPPEFTPHDDARLE